LSTSASISTIAARNKIEAGAQERCRQSLGSNGIAIREHEAFVAIETGEVIEGTLPRTAARLVKDWALARQDQLRENWRRARRGEQPERIAGLDAD
jgi:hypothetical protein